jgi:hypothetical protein
MQVSGTVVFATTQTLCRTAASGGFAVPLVRPPGNLGGELPGPAVERKRLRAAVALSVVFVFTACGVKRGLPHVLW